MICLSDNDIIRKLAICDLLAESLDALETSLGEVYVLNTARYVLLKPIKKPEVAKARLGEAVYDRLSTFLDSVRVLDVEPAPQEQQLFEDLLGIHPGEAVLFSATTHFPQCLLATSDKNSLTALASSPICHAICQRLSNRLICFEQVILRLTDRIGFANVRAKVIPARDCDTALRAIFGSGLEASEGNVRQGLASYIADLRGNTGTLLVDP